MDFWDQLGAGDSGEPPGGPGGRAVASLAAEGIVEPDFVVRRAAGFEWWPGPRALRVGVTPERTLEGLRVSRILVESDVCGAAPDTPALRERVDLLNRHASLSALVTTGTGGLVLAASLLAHEKNAGWTQRILAPLVALQAAEACAMAAVLAEVGAAPATSSHPAAGPREVSQAERSALVRHVLARSAAPELDARIFEDIAATLREAGLAAKADGRGLDVELPFAGETALVQMLGPMPHPGLGSGVLCLLVLPVLALRHPLASEGLPALLARLNAQARSARFHAESLPALGGWAPDPASGHPALAAFVPAALASDEVLTDLAMAQIARALLVARCFDECGDDSKAFARALAEAI